MERITRLLTRINFQERIVRPWRFTMDGMPEYFTPWQDLDLVLQVHTIPKQNSLLWLNMTNNEHQYYMWARAERARLESMGLRDWLKQDPPPSYVLR